MSPSTTMTDEQPFREMSSSPLSNSPDDASSTNDDLICSRSLSVPDEEEPVDLDELEQFASSFKQKRIKLGFTQGDVGVALGRLYGLDFSQTTISRFEGLNLSFKNMCKLKPLLEKWLRDTETAMKTGTLRSQMSKNVAETSTETANVKRRKKRTSIEGNLRNILENFFIQNPRPSTDMLDELAKTLDMKREVVRVWFCNRRQKERRSHPDRTCTLVSLSKPFTDRTGSISPGTIASAAGLLVMAQNTFLKGLF